MFCIFWNCHHLYVNLRVISLIIVYMKRLYLNYICILMMLSSSYLYSLDDEIMVQSAQNFLIEKEYEKALKLYHDIENEQYYSFGLYKNMAIAYAGLDKDAFAILYYERALKLSPLDSDIQSDLEAIRKRNPELDEGAPPFILATMWQIFTSLLNSTLWAILSLLFFGVAGFILYQHLPTPGMTKKNYRYLGVTLAFALLFVLASGSIYQRQFRQDQMIVTEPEVVLKTSPDAESPDIENLPDGSKVVIKDYISDWVQVQTSLGDIGWIKLDQGQKI